MDPLAYPFSLVFKYPFWPDAASSLTKDRKQDHRKLDRTTTMLNLLITWIIQAIFLGGFGQAVYIHSQNRRWCSSLAKAESDSGSRDVGDKWSSTSVREVEEEAQRGLRSSAPFPPSNALTGFKPHPTVSLDVDGTYKIVLSQRKCVEC